jgi:hypothetical protein
MQWETERPRLPVCPSLRQIVGFGPLRQAQLSSIFPNGICDYYQPGIGQQPLLGTYLLVQYGYVMPFFGLELLDMARDVASRRDDNRGRIANARQAAEALLKWFNVDKGFGFIARDGGGKDVVNEAPMAIKYEA